jgi:hypothetical protein
VPAKYQMAAPAASSALPKPASQPSGRSRPQRGGSERHRRGAEASKGEEEDSPTGGGRRWHWARHWRCTPQNGQHRWNRHWRPQTLPKCSKLTLWFWPRRNIHAAI